MIVLATLIGFWLSGRALAPIDQIIRTAQSIDASNLSDRLALPRSNDELRRLSETLNGMLDRVEEAVSRIRQFTADASHELRAPLTLIHTAAEYALRRPRSREELETGMRQIIKESDRTSRLVGDLLSLARGDASSHPPSNEPVDLAALGQTCVRANGHIRFREADRSRIPAGATTCLGYGGRITTQPALDDSLGQRGEVHGRPWLG